MAISSTVAKQDDGSIQITFIIPFSLIKEAQEKVISEKAKEIEVPGFRKGKAPLDKVREKIDQQTLLEKTLQQILPQAFSEAIKKHKIRPAIYPKFEIVKAQDGEDWQIRAVTCELPEIILGDYRKLISDSKTIWTPGAKEPSPEEKEQKVIKLLLEGIKIDLPQILIEEEANSRLANLLARIEKLGLTLEGYLSSLGKTPESLRNEYETQARNAIALDLILNKIALMEKIKVSESQIDEALKAATNDPKLYQKLNTPEQRLLIRGVLSRRAALDFLTSLG